MNLREVSNHLSSNDLKEKAFLWFGIHFVLLALILIIAWVVHHFSGSIEGAFLVSGILIYFWYVTISEFKLGLLSVVFSDSDSHIEYAICPNCFKNIKLFSEPDEAWICNFCSENIQGNILDPCPSCKELQRTFPCPFCGSIFDIDARYDVDKLKGERYNEQSKLIGR